MTHAPARVTPVDDVASIILATKRRTYRVYLLVILVGASALWLFLEAFGSDTSRVGARVVVPVVLGFALVSLFVLWRFPDAVRGIELAQYVACFVIFLAQLVVTLSVAPDDLGRHQAVAAFALWAPVTSIWAFLVFGSRGGLFGAYGFIGAAGVVITIAWFSGAGLGTQGTSFLVQLGVASVVFVAGLYVFTRLLERQTAGRTAAEVAAEYALRDVVTGLHTRFAFEVRLEQALAMARRTERTLALCFIDLDGFKAVNDTLGHAAGDTLLAEFARRLSTAVRESDTVARFGGDEFVVLAFVDDAAGAAEVAQKLVAAQETPFVLAGRDVTLRASVGVSLHPHDGDDGAALLRAADAAMYAAKAAKSGWMAATDLTRAL